MIDSGGGATWLVTGADTGFFVNSKLLVASWWRNNRAMPLVYLDFGLSQEQRAEVRSWPVLLIDQPEEFQGEHSWRSKAGLIRYLNATGQAWRNIVWIDADALLLQPLPPMDDLLAGYDLAIDAHRMAVVEVVKPENLAKLPLAPADAYFSSGFWMTSSAALLNNFDELVELVMHQGNLWENDAFVAAVYQTKARIRTLCGNIWHARGATSMQTSEVRGNGLYYEGTPVFVLHANWFYTMREDGRRILDRPELAAIQDHYEAEFERCLDEWAGM